MTLLHIDFGPCGMCRHDETTPDGYFVQVELLWFAFEFSFGFGR